MAGIAFSSIRSTSFRYRLLSIGNITPRQNAVPHIPTVTAATAVSNLQCQESLKSAFLTRFLRRTHLTFRIQSGKKARLVLQLIRLGTHRPGDQPFNLQVKTILNRVQGFVGFVYREVRMRCREGQPELIEIIVEQHGGIRGRCSQCQQPAPGYDRLPERRWAFVPLWGIPADFRYAPRRVQCPDHGVVVEHIPWSDGKRPMTCAMMGCLAGWARRLSRRETAQVFQTSWESVYRSVERFVQWGLAHRELQGG